MKKYIIILFIVVLGWKLFSYSGDVSYGPGILAKESPAQDNNVDLSSFAFKDYQVTPLANFHIKAKVLSIENYFLGRESDLSPVDFALGWGNMSDESILDQIQISQSGRWYRWTVNSFPIPRREIETHSANMHLIPADNEVENMISDARQGDIIELSGYLVKVTGDDGWKWKSSLSRDDTGNHACELIWVESFQIVSPL